MGFVPGSQKNNQQELQGQLIHGKAWGLLELPVEWLIGVISRLKSIGLFLIVWSDPRVGGESWCTMIQSGRALGKGSGQEYGLNPLLKKGMNQPVGPQN